MSTFPIFSFDYQGVFLLNGLSRSLAPLNPLAIFLAQGAPFIWAGLFLLVWLWPPRRVSRARRAVVYAVVSGIIALAINSALGHVLPYRPRPFLVEPDVVHQLIAHGRDTSFPSAHTAGSFAFAIAFFYWRWRAGLWAAVLAAAIGIARVWVGVHWPTDVLAGAVIGSLTALTTLAVRSHLERLVQWLFRRSGMTAVPDDPPVQP